MTSTQLYMTPTFKINAEDLILLNNDGFFKVFLTLSAKDAISFFDTNVERFQYTEKEKIGNTFVRFAYEGANAIDLICTLINEHILSTCPTIERNLNVFNRNTIQYEFRYKKLSPLAIPPNKTRASDSGLDLVLIDKKSSTGNVTFYGTGISVQPPSGYYFDLVPRSSITKKGYILGNNVGIIDQGYTGEIIVPLIKIDPNAPDLELPVKIVQLIPRKWFNFTPVNADSLANTARSDGGFGSTN